MSGAVRESAAPLDAPASLKAFSGFIPISGSALPPSDTYVTNGTDTAVMARVKVPIVSSIAMLRPVWTGRGLWQISEIGTSATLIAEADCPDSYSVSAAVETIDGRRKSITVGGLRRFIVPAGAPMMMADPLSMDIDVSDGYFWMRVFVLVSEAGKLIWRNRHAPNLVAGQSVSRYSFEPSTPPYRTALRDMLPSVYWPLDSVYGSVDVDTGRNGIGYGGGALPTPSLGPVSGSADGVFAGGAAEFDGVDDRIASTWKPFAPGTQFSWAGWVYLDRSKTHTLFGGGADANTATSFPTLRVNTDYSLTFVPRFGIGGATQYQWTGTGLGAGTWNFVAFSMDGAADKAQVWINGVPLTAKTGVVDDFAPTLTGEYEIGCYTTSGNPLDGRMSHVAAWLGKYLTDAEVAALYNASIPQAADQTQANGPLVATGATFTGSDLAYFPLLLLGTIRE